MAPRVLLVTTMNWPTSAKLAGAFAQAGAHVEALYPPGHVTGLSRFVSGRHIYRRLYPLTSIAEALATANVDVIVPCDDRAVRWLVALHARGQFAALIERSLGRVESYPTLMKRFAFMQAARALGIDTPDTVAVAGELISMPDLRSSAIPPFSNSTEAGAARA